MFADSSLLQLAYVNETDWGVTPEVAPVFTPLRLTGESLRIDQEGVQSEEIEANRNVSDIIQVGAGASGDINFELSYGTFDDILAGLMCADWATDVLTNGTKKKSLTFEKRFTVGASSYEFFRYRGMIPNTMSLSLTAREIITGSFGFLGKGGTVASSAIADATYDSASSSNVMSASAQFGSLGLGTLDPQPSLLSLELEITNNLREQPKLGSLDNAGVGLGRFEVTGSLEAYFENADVYNLFLNNSEFALSFVLGSETGSKYQFDLGSVKLTDANVVAGGNNQDVMSSVNFQGLYNAGDGGSLVITRGVA